jgi:hypothetical protein
MITVPNFRSQPILLSSEHIPLEQARDAGIDRG